MTAFSHLKMHLFSFKKPSKHTLSRQSKALCLLSLFLVFAFSGRGQTPTDSARNVADVVGEWLTAEYGLQPSTNNRLVIFKNGQEKFDDLFKAIKAARHSIHLEYFNFRNDSISALLFDLLAEKAAEGVEVKALFDGFGHVHTTCIGHFAVNDHNFAVVAMQRVVDPWETHRIKLHDVDAASSEVFEVMALERLVV